MGWTRHHVIIVTTFDERDCKVARTKAISLFGTQVSPINEATVNDYYSFAIFPDGSNEGWEDSDQGDRNRDVFKEWLKQFNDGGQDGYYDWVEVQYGDDKGETCISEDSDHPAEATIVDAVVMLPENG